jgi:hypothetical protein
MGYITPVLFYNDSIDSIEKDFYFGKRLVNQISRTTEKERVSNVSVLGFKEKWIDKILKTFGLARVNRTDCQSVSQCANILKPEHMDTQRVIVVYGNDWIDLTDQGEREFTENNPYLLSCLTIADRHVKLYKRYVKENKEKENEIRRNSIV